MNDYNINTKKKLAILISILVIFITIPIILYLFRPSKYGASIDIKGYDKYISDLPQDRRDSLNSSLYNIVKLNQKDNKKININDAYIRDKESTIKNYDKTTMITSGTFIVDISSIKQSYLMYYEWSNEIDAEFSGYTALAKCLDIDELKYGDFDCKDINTMQKEQRDPILDYLPYQTFNYIVTASYDSEDKVVLNVNIYLSSSDAKDENRDAIIDGYKADFMSWMTSIGYNIEDYTINYIVNG